RWSQPPELPPELPHEPPELPQLPPELPQLPPELPQLPPELPHEPCPAHAVLAPNVTKTATTPLTHRCRITRNPHSFALNRHRSQRSTAPCVAVAGRSANGGKVRQIEKVSWPYQSHLAYQV
ncbi:MAG TPA: hypothetical protein ENJ50_09200, partial [Planctomycetaceae bacterium]|nr:hypothetical protein [Planctomycetaceae bacterium]